ncbi:MAG: hypothetical protein ACRDST_09160 [Pseudonocardiaceae bacterium]
MTGSVGVVGGGQPGRRCCSGMLGGVIGSEGWIAEKFDRRALSYDQSAVHGWQATQAARFLAPRKGVDVLDVATGTACRT